MATGGVISGTTKGAGGSALARHLADRRRSQENEVTRLGATRGIIAQTIEEGIIELTGIVSHSRSTQPIYHVHVDPEFTWTRSQWDGFWLLFENEFDLGSQPFVEAVHIKHEREHRHRAYSRLRRNGTVIPISHDYARREKICRLAEFEFAGRHVSGAHNRAVAVALRHEGHFDALKSIEAAGLSSSPRPVARMTPRQRYQASRTGLDSEAIAVIVLQLWRQTETDRLVQGFALEGLHLCQDDPGPVLIDIAGGVHSLTRVIGKASAATGNRIRAAEVKARVFLLNLPQQSNYRDQHHDRTYQTETLSDMDIAANILDVEGGGTKAEEQDFRTRLLTNIDQRGFSLNDAATLHTFENSETMIKQLDQLLTPRPGEQSKLEKILELLAIVARTTAQIVKGQANLGERLAEIELQITGLSTFFDSENTG